MVARLQEDSDQTLLGSQDSESPRGSTPRQRPGFEQFDPLNVRRIDSQPTNPEFSGPRDYSPSEDDEDFVPAEPASLSTVEPAIALAWVGAAGAPIALLCAAIFWRNAPLLAIIALILVFILAVGYLIYRLPGQRENDDDGARL
nr:hypothetical protein [Psychromicrobium silvestre]